MGELSTRSIAEIELEIQQARSNLLDHVHGLKRAMRRELDWRVHVVRNPVPVVCAAFVIGLLLGSR